MDGLTFNIEQDNNEFRQPSLISLNALERKPVVGSESLSFPNALPSWSDIVRRKLPRNLINNFKHSVLLHGSIDKEEARQCLIVSGLEPTADKPDSELFSAMFQDEFDIKPDIFKTNRLGKNNQPEGKTKPFLVILREVTQVQKLLACARPLRRSTDAATRYRVFINPNLTKAEAEAAYQLREKRRQLPQQRAKRSAAKQRTSSS